MVIEPAAMAEAGSNASPITSIVLLADKAKCPDDFTVIAHASDDASCDADMWRDGWFSFSKVYRYLAVCRTPQPPVPSVISDITIVSHEDTCPPGFAPVAQTADSGERALRHKQLAVRFTPRDTAVDAVCDLLVLAKQKRPPHGYTLAGEIDGLTICFKYGVIPADFAPGSPRRSAERDESGGGGGGGVRYPGLPYPLHPCQPQGAGAVSPMELAMTAANRQQQQQASAGATGSPLYNGYDTFNRQCSSGTGVDGVPFKPHPLLASLAGGNQDDVPVIKEDLLRRLDSDFSYDFRIESQILENMLTSPQ